MAGQRYDTLQVRSSEDIVRVRQAARAWAVELGFSLVEQTKLVTAASELARNTVDNHKSRAMAKLGCDKAALLTRIAIKQRVTTMNDKLTAAEERRRGRRKDGWN